MTNRLITSEYWCFDTQLKKKEKAPQAMLLKESDPVLPINCYSFKPHPIIFVTAEESYTPSDLTIGFENEISFENLQKESRKKIKEYSSIFDKFELDGFSRDDEDENLHIRRPGEKIAYKLFEALPQKLKSTIGEPLIYFKSDSSAGGGMGFEAVSHPMTRKFYDTNREVFKEYFTKMDTIPYISSGEGTTCGLHFHVNKSYLSPTNIRNIMLFMMFNHELFLAISRREPRDLAEWANLYDYRQLWQTIENDPNELLNPFKGISWENKQTILKLIEDNPKSKKALQYAAISTHRRLQSLHGRRMALNLSPQRTIEFRFFKGTLKWENFAMAFEFLLAVLDFCRKPSGYSLDAFMSYIYNPARSYQYPELVSNLSRLVIQDSSVYKKGDK